MARRSDADHGLAPEGAMELARQFFRSYVYQVAVEGVYHADPHPRQRAADHGPWLALVDFGLLGRLDDDTRRGLSLLLLAIAPEPRGRRVGSIISLSLTSVKSDQPAFLHDVRRKLPRFHRRPLASDPCRGVARRPAADRASSTALRADELRARRQDARAGRLDRARALSGARPDRADGGRGARGDARSRPSGGSSPTSLFAYVYTQLDPLLQMPRRLGHVAERGSSRAR